MFTDRKDNKGKPKRDTELAKLAKKIQSSDEAKIKILMKLTKKKDEQALIWLYQKKIIDGKEQLRYPITEPVYQSSLLKRAIEFNLLLFIKEILKNSPESFEPTDYSVWLPEKNIPYYKHLPYYKNNRVEFAPSAEMVGLFIKYLPDYNINQCDYHSETILWKLAQQGQFIDVVKLVLIYNADVHWKRTFCEVPENATPEPLLQHLVGFYIEERSMASQGVVRDWIGMKRDLSADEIKRADSMSKNFLEIIRFLASRGASIEGIEKVYQSYRSPPKSVSVQQTIPPNPLWVTYLKLIFFGPSYTEQKPILVDETPQYILEAINKVKEAIAEGQAMGPSEERYKKLLEVNVAFGLPRPLSEIVRDYESEEADIIKDKKDMKKGF